MTERPLRIAAVVILVGTVALLAFPIAAVAVLRMLLIHPLLPLVRRGFDRLTGHDRLRAEHLRSN